MPPHAKAGGPNGPGVAWGVAGRLLGLSFGPGLPEGRSVVVVVFGGLTGGGDLGG